MKNIFSIIAALLALAFCARAEPIFSIGKPDAKAAEFNSFGVDFNCNSYYHPPGTDPFRPSKEFFSKPFVFEVGKNIDADWPFVHPVRRCEWADISFIRPHPSQHMYFTDTQYKNNKTTYGPLKIKFKLNFEPQKSLYLKIGFVDKAPFFVNGTALKISVNDAEVSTFELPYKYDAEKNPYPCFSNLVLNPKTWGIPQGHVVEIPASALREGENEISLQALAAKKSLGAEWFAYDYLELSENSELPKIENPLNAEAEKAMASLNFDEIVFSMRGQANDLHWYGNFGYYPDPYIGYTKETSPMSHFKYSKLVGKLAVNPKDARTDPCVFAREGCKLAIFNLKTGNAKEIVSDPKGDVRNPCVSFDADKIMYSYRRGNSDTFDIYECNIDGTSAQIHPLSDSKFDDIEPTYLPNGDIAFVSTRCERTVPCWMVDVGIMYRWFGDEKVVRAISANVDQDNSPWPCDDGNIIYMKWEYVHKSQLNFHTLWKKYPDASYDMVFFGNDIPCHLLIDAKEVPENPNKFVLTFGNNHGYTDHRGRVAAIDSPRNPGDYQAFRFISGDMFRDEKGKPQRNSYTSPFPVGDKYILAVLEGRRIVLMDYQGHALKVFPLPANFGAFKDNYIMEVSPLKKRKKGRILPDMADFSQSDATVVLMDAAIGRNMSGVKPGDIKKLMVSEILPHIIHLFGGSEPLSLRGAFSYERYLGTVEVEKDGSAHFKVPAGRALSFTALDKDGKAVKRMHSFTSFAPGTSTSCIGCHENRDMAPPPVKNILSALRRPPDIPVPIDGVPQGEVIDYVRDIQPIWDKHCLNCHNSVNYAGKLDLSRGQGAMMPLSYFRLRTLRQIDDGYNLNGNFAPYAFGSGSSPIMNKVDGSHKGVKVSNNEMNMLKVWLDTGGTASQSGACWEAGMLKWYYANLPLRVDKNWSENKVLAEVVEKNCASCHVGATELPRRLSGNDNEKDAWRWLWDYKKYAPQNRISSHTVFNTSYPENSPMLLEPLAVEAGGRAKEGGHPVIFKDKNDANYKAILSAIERAKKFIDEENPHYTSPNYEPRGAYLGALKRREIIKDGDNLKNFDAFKADKKYWKKSTGTHAF